MVHSIPEFTLNDGLKLPAIGLGTYQLKGIDGVRAIYKCDRYRISFT